jgi:hypothetical protein
MSASFTITVTDNYANNQYIIDTLNPNAPGYTTQPPDWLRNLSSYLQACAEGSRSVSVVYTDSSGTTTVHAGA